ncbi:MAG TPA: hypothetical protein VK636_05780, partial [Gemmatimonadaceae bacterium]|nr:hypothetical protein [Gemmatimonadaceae bacterium]
MSDFTDPNHTPTPEFRASLEREIARAYRAELQFESPRGARMRRFGMVVGLAAGAVITLTIGLVLGASTGYASAEVLDARQREATATTIVTKRQLATVRLDLARLNSENVYHAFERGAASRAAVRASEAQVDSMQANLARMSRELNMSGDTAQPSRPTFALLRNLPMRNALTALTCGAVALTPAPTPAQQAIPVVNLPPAMTKSAQTLGGILGMRQVADGKVLVNDAVRRQIKLFDSTLAGATVVMDTMPGTSRSYGSRPTPLVPYVGDSSLFADWSARAMLVLDGRGQVARALALPTQRDLWAMNTSYSGADSKGRLIYRGTRRTAPHARTPDIAYVDSLLLLRADLD